MRASVLGNVIRYEVDVSGLAVTVDTLFDKAGQEHRLGSRVTLHIPKDEWKAIQKSPSKTGR